MSSLASMRGPAMARRASAEDLLRRLRDGDQQAREQLCAKFLPLARKLAGRYANPIEPMEDLVQIANVGLLAAIDRFNPDRGTHFATFAVPTILGELRRHFRNTAWSAHVPRGAQEMAMRVDQATRALTEATGRAPTAPMLAEYLHVDLDDVLIGLEAGTAHYATSLDAPVSGADIDEPEALINRIGHRDDGYGLVETRLSLQAAVARLPYLERRALTMRINHDMKQSDIAKEMGCSQMQVSRLLRRAAETLRRLTDGSAFFAGGLSASTRPPSPSGAHPLTCSIPRVGLGHAASRLVPSSGRLRGRTTDQLDRIEHGPA
jgi:RNA polymerase sigma-B factor